KHGIFFFQQGRSKAAPYFLNQAGRKRFAPTYSRRGNLLRQVLRGWQALRADVYGTFGRAANVTMFSGRGMRSGLAGTERIRPIRNAGSNIPRVQGGGWDDALWPFVASSRGASHRPDSTDCER